MSKLLARSRERRDRLKTCIGINLAALALCCAALQAGCAPITSARTHPSAPEITISPDDVRRHVLVLADDAFEGRGAGYPGEEKAVDYIARQFHEAGLDTFVQSFTFHPRGPVDGNDTLTSRNLLAILPGSDARLADQVVIVGAHHDGQGMPGQADAGRYPATEPAASGDTIWNSADDNASSVAALIEIARVMAAHHPKPRRTIVFATFGAEEHALNGSGFLAQNPWPAHSRRVGMINVEKIGRVPHQPLIAAGCSTSAGWTELLGEAGRSSGDTVDCLIPELVSDTDHYPFGALGIPAMVVGTAHEEDTHQPTDEASRLDFEALARRARFISHLIELLADREAPLTYSNDARRGSGIIALAACDDERIRLRLGEHGALKIGLVLPGLPGARSGLQPGDFVTAIDGKPLEAHANDRAIEESVIGKPHLILDVLRGTVSMRLTIGQEEVRKGGT